MKKTIIITSLFLSLFSFAQETAEKENLLPLPKMSYLDSLKTTFVNHSTSNCIDERWLTELASTELSDNMFSDIADISVQQLQRDPIQEWYLSDKQDEEFD